MLCDGSRYKNVLVSNNQDSVAKEFNEEMDRHYGIIAARLCGLPESLVSQAEAEAAQWTKDVLEQARQDCEVQKTEARSRLDQAAAFLAEKVVS